MNCFPINCFPTIDAFPSVEYYPTSDMSGGTGILDGGSVGGYPDYAYPSV